MATTKKDTAPEPDRLTSLRAEIVEVLEEYCDALNDAAEKSPGEHNVEALRVAHIALHLFKPDVANVYS